MGRSSECVATVQALRPHIKALCGIVRGVGSKALEALVSRACRKVRERMCPEERAAAARKSFPAWLTKEVCDALLAGAVTAEEGDIPADVLGPAAPEPAAGTPAAATGTTAGVAAGPLPAGPLPAGPLVPRPESAGPQPLPAGAAVAAPVAKAPHRHYVMSRACDKFISLNRRELQEEAKKVKRGRRSLEKQVRLCGRSKWRAMAPEDRLKYIALARQGAARTRSALTGQFQALSSL